MEAADDVETDRLDRQADNDDAAPGRGRSMIVSQAFGEPEHSKTTSAPQPSVSRETLFGKVLLADIDRNDALVLRGDIELRLGEISDDHPGAAPARAASATIVPIGPAPSTTAVSPGASFALVAACMPTAKGSTMAPSAKLTLSGSLNV